MMALNIRKENEMIDFYKDTKAGVNFKIEQLLIEKQKWIDDQLSNFNMFERTTDIIKLIHQQASERYGERLESLHQHYNKL